MRNGVHGADAPLLRTERSLAGTREFFDEVVAQNPDFDREYVAGFWTDYYGNCGKPARVLKYLHSLPPEQEFFTVIQHCRGFQGACPENLLVFAAGGAGDFPIPLLVPSLTPDFSPHCRVHRVSFMGKYRGPNDATGVRSAMVAAMRGRAGFNLLESRPYSGYCQSLKGSVFVLCPRGFGRTSFRLYETLAMNSIPVYIWDDVEWLPYKGDLDWSRVFGKPQRGPHRRVAHDAGKL